MINGNAYYLMENALSLFRNSNQQTRIITSAQYERIKLASIIKNRFISKSRPSRASKGLPGPNSGKVWWIKDGLTTLNKESPGIGWKKGYGSNFMKRWNNGIMQVMTENSPGLDWSSGYINSGTTGFRWWNNSIINEVRYCKECPGPEWEPGRK